MVPVTAFLFHEAQLERGTKGTASSIPPPAHECVIRAWKGRTPGVPPANPEEAPGLIWPAFPAAEETEGVDKEEEEEEEKGIRQRKVTGGLHGL